MTNTSTPLTVALREIGRDHAALVGAKAVHLGELSRMEGLSVPPGLCVTTNVFQRVLAESTLVDEQLTRLAGVPLDSRDTVRAVSAELRTTIEGIDLPGDLAAELLRSVASALGDGGPCAVRSSATAEDLPTASFAGLQDSYLNVIGRKAVLKHVQRCWASLFTERAVTYRLRHGFDHRAVQMAVIVQRMIHPRASGVMFTADPVTGHRRLTSVEACLGLGEALVSGLVTPDTFTVRDGAIIARTIADKPLAIVPSPAGGTLRQQLDAREGHVSSLAEAQVVQLAELGRKVEAYFGAPQDIEWCLADDQFHILQSRPITTLFPVPDAGDRKFHVYVSVGHQQMMTDPIKPLGLSIWQLTTPRPMAEAGGRLFVDVTSMLASPTSRPQILQMPGKSDPLIGDALHTILDRGDLAPSQPTAAPDWTPPGAGAGAIATDADLVVELMERSQAALTALQHEITAKSGSHLLDFIQEDILAKRGVQADPRSLQVVMAGMEAAWWLNDHLQAWLGVKNLADRLTQSVPNNVTSEMGLALLAVADVIRRHQCVVDVLRRVRDDGFLDTLPELHGGQDCRDAIATWLEKYGMRGVGEIDITRPRWSEHPTLLVPILLGHVDHAQPGAAARLFESGRQQALDQEEDILTRLRGLPDGAAKAAETKRMIDRLRTFAGYREYPKYAMVSRYFVYKQALLEEADRLVQAGVVRERHDIFYLRFEELRDVVRTHRVDYELINERRAALRSYRALTPPRVLTSDGEVVTGEYRRDGVPTGALVGLPVSAGVVEGRARVILNLADAKLESGDILVTTYTDPSWTPLFLGIKGLVTEVGGLMTHGAVIAREYGLPAVVGVQHATQRIRNHQQIRVHGTGGYVEVL